MLQIKNWELRNQIHQFRSRKTYISFKRKILLKFARKISNLKIKISSLGSKSSSNILIRKNTGRGRNKHCWKLGNNTLEATEIQLVFLCLGILASQVHALNWFAETNFILPTTLSGAKELASDYEIQVAGEINMSQKEERPHSNDKETLKEFKDKS